MSHSSSGSSSGETVTVVSTGEVVKVMFFFPTITVDAQASARVEEFEPQGAP